MTVTDIYVQGGVSIGGAADVAFTHGSDDPAPSDLVLEWDFDNDGDFDLADEDTTDDLDEVETTTGRDYPSQLTGRVGPGQLKAKLRNDDNRYSHFNQSSPLNQAPLSLATGRKLRLRTVEATDADPVLLARDRFRRPDGPLTTTETGQTWATPGAPWAAFTVVSETATATVVDSGDPGRHINTIDVAAADYYIQIRCGRKLIANPNIPQVFPEVGVIYRYTDANNFSMFRFSPQNEFPPQRFQMVDRVAGVETVAGSGNFFLEAHAGMSLGVIVQDGWAIPVVDGVPRPGDGVTALGSATRVGMWGWWAGNVPPEVERIDVWDRFTVVDPTADLAPAFPAGNAASEPTTPTTSHVAPSVNAPAATDLLICAWQSDDAAPQTYTAPGSMTGASPTLGTITDMLSAHQQLSAAGATGTRTATYGTTDLWSAVSVIVHADTVGIEQTAASDATAADVVLNAAAATQAGWWFLAIQGGDQAGASSMAPLPGWEPVADTEFFDTSRIIASARQVTTPGSQSVTFPAGTLTNNHARLYVLSGPATPDAFTAVTDGVLWTGDVDDIKPSANLGPDNTAALAGTGWLSKLATHKLQFPGTLTGRHTGAAVGKVLADSGLLYPPGGLDQGAIFTGAVGFDELDAIEIARRFEETELGFMHEAQEGWIDFDARNARAGAVSQATFSDAPGAQFGYRTLELLGWRREIFNRVEAGVAPTTPSLPVGTSFAGSSSAPATTTIQHNVTSFDIEPGDLMVAFSICGGFAGVTWKPPLGWVDLTGSKPKELPAGAVDDNFRVFAKPCDGTETGSQVFATASANVSHITQVWLIKNWFRDPQGIVLSEEVAGSDPAPVSIGWAPQPGALLTCRVGRMGTATVADWTSQQFDGYQLSAEDVQQGVAGQHMAIQTAWRQIIAAQTFDPSPFDGTFNGFSDVRTVTVAIRGFNGNPPVLNGNPTVTVEDRVSQDRHNAIKSYRNPANLYADEADAEAYGQAVLARHAQDRPLLRLSFHANLNAAYRAQAIRRRVGHKITLVADGDAASKGTGMGIVGDFFIEHITNRITDAGKVWLVTWELSPA